MPRTTLTIAALLLVARAGCPDMPPTRDMAVLTRTPAGMRTGPVRVVGHSLTDRGGPFLGFGVSYFTALWRCRHDRARLESDLAFLSSQGFNYCRMLSMVGWNASWEGLEIAPASFTSHDGRRVEAWPDYWQQLSALVDLAYGRFGIRTQITIFADAQLMPRKQDRIEHMRRLLAEVVAGREDKIILLEVANEGWQNGFPGSQGTADLREFTQYLTDRTEVPVATTSNHEGAFAELYGESAADIATWHFSRDRRADDGWGSVHDCWDLGDLPGLPPLSSNEPIGPGASVASESESTRLVMAAAFAYAAKLPMYVFHCEAGVHGRTRFEETPAICSFGRLRTILPADLPNWQRRDARDPEALFTVFAAGQADQVWPEQPGAQDGCVRMVESRRQERFVCVPIGIRPGGLRLEARAALRFRAYDPITGTVQGAWTLPVGGECRLPAGRGAWILVGRLRP